MTELPIDVLLTLVPFFVFQFGTVSVRAFSSLSGQYSWMGIFLMKILIAK